MMECFNPHPLRRAGATAQAWRVLRKEEGFNPHPLRRAGATWAASDMTSGWGSFNPHPLRRAGATQGLRSPLQAERVSILTRSEERVQPALTA
jgi:hypothetical protein